MELLNDLHFRNSYLFLKAWFKYSHLLWDAFPDLSQRVGLMLGQASVTALSLCILLFTFLSSVPRLLEVRAASYSFGFLPPTPLDITGREG